MVGAALKKIRKDKNIPIRLICDGIMDPGNYWRLENGEIDSSFTTILKILERMNISIEEFAEELNIEDEVYQTYQKKFVGFFKNKDIKNLKKLKQTVADKLAHHETLKLSHLHALIDIYIFRIDHTWQAKKSKALIKKYLARSNNWHSYELALLNNVLFIYDIDTSFLFYKTAANNFSSRDSKQIIPLTLNMLALSIEHDDKEKVRYLLTIFSKIELEEGSMYERTIKKWGVAIGRYYLTNLENYLLEAEEVLQVFLTMDMEQTFNLYRSWTDSYKKLVNRSKNIDSSGEKNQFS